MSIVVTGTHMPTSVAVSVFECGLGVAILHVPSHVNMIRAIMQHREILDKADITLRTYRLDIEPGRYECVDLGDFTGENMAAFVAQTGAVHFTTATDDIGHVVLTERGIDALGPCVSRVVGEKPEAANYSA